MPHALARDLEGDREGDDRREILIAGLGSIGRRHLANLVALGWDRIRLLRTGRSTLPDRDLDGWPVDRDLDEALARRPLAVIVATPTSRHLDVAIPAARAGAHLLVEKPLSHDPGGIDELARDVEARGLAALVGFQFRFHPAFLQVKRWLDEGAIGTVVSADVHWGEHLPDLHPWEDFRRGYAARADLGGGVLLTFCHPFDYLRWLLGEIREVSAAEAGHGRLGLDVDTVVNIGVRFAGGAIGHVHLNFVQQPSEHRLRIVGEAGTIVWSQDDHAARRYVPAEQRWAAAPPPPGFTRNDLFLAEMRHFLACLRGGDAPACTLRDGLAVQRVVADARRALDGVCA